MLYFVKPCYLGPVIQAADGAPLVDQLVPADWSRKQAACGHEAAEDHGQLCPEPPSTATVPAPCGVCDAAVFAMRRFATAHLLVHEVTFSLLMR